MFSLVIDQTDFLKIFCMFPVHKSSQIKMPSAIERCVRRQNIMFMHEKSQFCPEYFQFMKKLLMCNPVIHGTPEKLVSVLKIKNMNVDF